MSEETINFADIEDSKTFDPVPRGRYVLEITDVTDRFASDESKNPGARMLNWEFTIPEDEEYGNQKLWDLQVCVPKSLWKVKGLFQALGINTENLSYSMGTQKFTTLDEDGDSVEIDVEDYIGKKVEAKVGIQPATRDQDARNQLKQFYEYEGDDDDLA